MDIRRLYLLILQHKDALLDLVFYYTVPKNPFLYPCALYTRITRPCCCHAACIVLPVLLSSQEKCLIRSATHRMAPRPRERGEIFLFRGRGEGGMYYVLDVAFQSSTFFAVEIIE